MAEEKPNTSAPVEWGLYAQLLSGQWLPAKDDSPKAPPPPDPKLPIDELLSEHLRHPGTLKTLAKGLRLLANHVDSGDMHLKQLDGQAGRLIQRAEDANVFQPWPSLRKSWAGPSSLVQLKGLALWLDENGYGVGWTKPQPADVRRVAEALERLGTPKERSEAAQGIEPASPAAVGQAEPPAEPKASHSADFTHVDWFGTRYLFDDGQQAKAIGCLWAEFETGEFGLSEKSIGEAIGSASDNYRLAQTFRLNAKGRGKRKKGRKATMHLAWGTMIQKVSPGVYRLAKPGIPR